MSPLVIQIIGTKKCSETRKAERFFKERGVTAHFRDAAQKELSAGEIKNICNAVGGLDAIIDRGGKEFEKRNLKYISVDWMKALQRWPKLLKTPIVRCGGRATVGPAKETWQ